MNSLPESLIFTVPLGTSAHRLALQFRSQQKTSQKGKQIYLNTLAVFAVQFYLRCMSIKTDWEASYSWNTVTQTLMDAADLYIPELGLLECLPVLPNTQIIHVPPEVRPDRIGYVAVQFDESLLEATLIGFTQTVPATGELPISQMRSLEDLLELFERSQPEPCSNVKLSQWFENFFVAGWQSLEALLATEGNLTFNLRSKSSLSKNSVKAAKLIDLGVQLGNKCVALLVAIAPDAEQTGIVVQVHPTRGDAYLPPNLRLSLLSESAVIQEVRSRLQDSYIQMKRFRGKHGETFSIMVALDEVSVTENFII